MLLLPRPSAYHTRFEREDRTNLWCSPEQLMILDDPAFNPDNALPALDFDFPSIILAPANDSQRSTQSMMSIAPSRSASISSHTASIGINLPSSSTHNAYQLPSNSHFDPSSAVKGTGRSVLDDEADLFQDDMVFEFDENGEMRDIPDDEQARRASRLGSDSAASRRVRKEHDDAAAVTGRVRDMLDSDGDFDMAHFGEGSILPDAEAFPTSAAMMSGGLGLHDDNDSRPALDAKDRVYSEEPPSSDSAEAPQKRSRLKAKKVVLGIDRATELGGRDLLLWQREYGDNMTAGRLLKADKRGKTVAKKNAWVFVWESGLNGVGCGVGFESVRSPLDMFAGGRLFETVTGRALVDEVCLPSPLEANVAHVFACPYSSSLHQLVSLDDEPKLTNTTGPLQTQEIHQTRARFLLPFPQTPPPHP
jgi:meiotic recombination protein REC8